MLAGLGAAAGCGTILYPERRGQPAGRLDWGVVALDGIGLILFFVPGVIAFAIDFATGAIYLPPDDGPSYSLGRRQGNLRTIVVKPDRLSRAEVARVLSAETGRAITLQEGSYVTTKLPALDHFWPAVDKLAAATDCDTEMTVRAQGP